MVAASTILTPVQTVKVIICWPCSSIAQCGMQASKISIWINNTSTNTCFTKNNKVFVYTISNEFESCNLKQCFFNNQIPFGGQCKMNTQCQGSKHAVVCELGRCVCRPGYVSTNLECHKGKLKMLFKEYGT